MAKKKLDKKVLTSIFCMLAQCIVRFLCKDFCSTKAELKSI